MAKPADLDPLELLRSDLKDEDHEQVVASVNRVGIIALALGPERVRKDLVPFLQDYVSSTDSDEVHAAIAAQLGDFVPYCGGPEQASVLLNFFEHLCSLEETLIRTAAVQSFQKVITQLPKKETIAKVFPMIKRLANGEWFTTRVSACGLFAATYPALPEDLQAELRSVFNNLCNDDTPMVRKAAYTCLSDFAHVIQKEHIKSDIMPMVKALSEDDLDTMRIFTIDCCASISNALDPSEFAVFVLPLIEAIHDDGSWRVRQQLVKSLETLCKNAGEEIASNKLLPLYCKLLQDTEVQVRITSTKLIDKIAPHCKSGLLTHLTPCLEYMASDQNEKVRTAFSQAVIGLCSAFGPEASQKLLVPIVQQLAKDELPDVRNNIISRVDLLGQCLGNEQAVDTILPTLLELSKDPKWRVRMEVVGKASSLGKQMGVDIFEKKLMPIVISGLSDHVFSIRERACEQVCALVATFGDAWAVEKLFPPTFAVFDRSTNYLHRMTALLIASNMSNVVKPAVIEKHLLPLVLSACKDDVANVRFAAAKTLYKLAPVIDKAIIESHVRPALSALQKDEDVDVQYFSEEAVKLCQQ